MQDETQREGISEKIGLRDARDNPKIIQTADVCATPFSTGSQPSPQAQHDGAYNNPS
jgi:hypothetical protein